MLMEESLQQLSQIAPLFERKQQLLKVTFEMQQLNQANLNYFDDLNQGVDKLVSQTTQGTAAATDQLRSHLASARQGVADPLLDYRRPPAQVSRLTALQRADYSTRMGASGTATQTLRQAARRRRTLGAVRRDEQQVSVSHQRATDVGQPILCRPKNV